MADIGANGGWTDPHDIREARALVAIARANERDARVKAAELERAVAELEREVQGRYADVLDLYGKLAGRAITRDSARTLSDAAVEVRDRFADIRSRSGTNASLVTVVIPVHGKLDYTLRCLRSIAKSWSFTINPTIIIVDDASPDGSVHELIGIAGIDVVRNGTNLGYLRSSNRGADLAKTPYVCFLNNDTEVRNGWLDTLVQTADSEENVGAVGSKLIYPDGTLQEAGSIIWSDATGWNFGRGDDPAKSEYNVARDVDYCSAASLLVRTSLLREIGGFDERFVPAYYEDADLCFEVRARGFRVVYEPRSEVIHYEGVSSGTDVAAGVKRFQEINRPKFAEKWRGVLPTHFGPSADNVMHAVRPNAAKTVLIIDSYVPMHDREAGSNRLFKIIQILRAAQYHVLFFPANGTPIEPYSTDLSRLGVEVAYMRSGIKDQETLLATIARRGDLAWICRPELCERFLSIIREHSTAPIVYDTIDLHFARERRRAEIEGGGDELWQKLQTTELAMARAADLVVTVTDIERNDLAQLGIEHVAVIPTIHDLEPHEHFGYDVRTGIIFIGGYGHTPNVDAALWLCNEIMPIVWQSIPAMKVTLLGNRPPGSILNLRSDLVTVTGFVADVRPYFEEARLFVAPLRYGAGMKGKVGHAVSYGLPLVGTSVAVEGYDLTDGVDCAIADDAKSFARAIVAVYNDRATWRRYSEAGEASIRNFGVEAVGEKLRDLFARLGAGTESN